MRQPDSPTAVAFTCHMQDVRRAIGRTRQGKPRQVPVICELDVLEVTDCSRETWSSKVMLVTCPDCLERIDTGADRP